MTPGQRHTLAVPPRAGEFGSFQEHLAVLMSQALQLFAFEHQGKPVVVDGMRPREGGAPAPVRPARPIHYETVADYRHGEPRIALFVSLFARLLASFSLTWRGEPVAVDGVRLANLARWSRYRYDSLFANFAAISSVCTANCVFCYRHGSLNSRLLNLSSRVLSVEEAKTRARYWQADRKLGLPVRRADDGEAFSNRHIFEILDVARRVEPRTVFALTTNGDHLDQGTVRRLSAYLPLVVTLSVNTIDVARRRELMRPLNAANGARAPERLREAGIPFVGSIVADQRLGLADIEQTIRYLDANHALMTRIMLPGYTKHSADRALPGLDGWWRQVTDFALGLRREVESPILVSPALYWDTGVVPRVEGLYRQSIARAAGLMIGDVVLAVNGLGVCTKTEVLKVLEADSLAGRTCTLRIDRGGRAFDVVLDPAVGADATRTGPSPAVRYARYGVFMNQGLDMESLVWIRRYLKRFSRTLRVLLFSTPLGRPHLLQMATCLKDFGRGHDVRTTVADHEYWGGNIMVGDVHVVDDYIRKVDRLAQRGWTPDIVFIPDSFLTGRWGLDVVGNSHRRIERETGVRTVLVPSPRIME